MDTSLHFIINTFSNITYSYCQVRIPKLYKRVTAMSYVLNRYDDTMTDLPNIHLATLLSAQCGLLSAQCGLLSAQCISWRPVIIPSNLYFPMILVLFSCHECQRVYSTSLQKERDREIYRKKITFWIWWQFSITISMSAN